MTVYIVLLCPSLDKIPTEDASYSLAEGKKVGDGKIAADKMQAWINPRQEWARLSDYLVASEECARGLGWGLAAKVLRQEKEKLGIKALTITLGERGSITASGDDIFEVPAFRVKAVDTTGAGDVFHGGYLYGVLQGWDLRTAVIFASALAAMKCRMIGGRAGIPGLSEALRFLREKGLSFPG